MENEEERVTLKNYSCPECGAPMVFDGVEMECIQPDCEAFGKKFSKDWKSA